MTEHDRYNIPWLEHKYPDRKDGMTSPHPPLSFRSHPTIVFQNLQISAVPWRGRTIALGVVETDLKNLHTL